MNSQHNRFPIFSRFYTRNSQNVFFNYMGRNKNESEINDFFRQTFTPRSISDWMNFIEVTPRDAVVSTNS